MRSLARLVTFGAALSMSGCCGPCARWIATGIANDSSAPPPPLLPASESAEPGTPPGNGPPGASTTGSIRSSKQRHPVFPGRRGYIEFRTHFKSGGVRIQQLTDPKAVFESMPVDGKRAPTDDLVVCRVLVKSRFDEFRGADTAGTLTVGARKFEFYGPEDVDLVYFSVPHARWGAGEKLTLTLWDRDLTTNEAIGTVSGPADALPFTLTADNMDVTCRAWSSDAVEQEAKALTKSAATIAAKARATKPTPALPEWGYGRSGIPEAWAAVDELAAHVGWDDARVRQAGQELEKLEVAWTAAAEKSVAAEIARLPPLSKGTVTRLREVDAVVKPLVCDAAKAKALVAGAKSYVDPTEIAPCIIEVQATRTLPADSLFLFPDVAVRATLVFADGSEVGLTQVELLDGKGQPPADFQWSPAPGGSYTMRFVPSANVPIGSHPGAPSAASAGPAKLLRFESPQKSGAPALVRLDG